MELIMNILPMLLIFGVMYFLLIRPQKKQMEEKRSMLDTLAKGNEVVTIGGLHGVVEEVNRDLGTLVIDCEGVYLTFELASIAKVTPTSPVKSEVTVEDLSPETGPLVEEDEEVEDNL